MNIIVMRRDGRGESRKKANTSRDFRGRGLEIVSLRQNEAEIRFGGVMMRLPPPPI